jgi:hypothetical protein
MTKQLVSSASSQIADPSSLSGKSRAPGKSNLAEEQSAGMG